MFGVARVESPIGGGVCVWPPLPCLNLSETAKNSCGCKALPARECAVASLCVNDVFAKWMDVCIVRFDGVRLPSSPYTGFRIGGQGGGNTFMPSFTCFEPITTFVAHRVESLSSRIIFKQWLRQIID